MSSVSVQTLRTSLRMNAGMHVVRPGKKAPKDAMQDYLLRQLERKPKKPRKLDGFLMLEACRVELPMEAVQARLADQALIAVVQEDLKYFVRLEWIDAGENQLRLEMFSVLPSLKELRLHCNAISYVPQLHGLQSLQRLDMSYNALDAESIQNLSSLGALRELDLSGNQLSYLPDMDGFKSLEKLILEFNCFSHEDIFHEVAKLPRLQHLSCAHNMLRGFDAPRSPSRRMFPVLEHLDLAFNKIESSDALSAVLSFQRLRAVLVYGNPLCGPTGEDPTKLCVEDLTIAAIEMGRMPGNTLQFVTEVPRKKRRRWNQHPGRQAFYQNIDMKHVAPFDELPPETIPNQDEEPDAFSKYMGSLNLGVPDPKPSDTFLTGMDLPAERPTDTMFDLRRAIETTIQRATNKAAGNACPESTSPHHHDFSDVDAVPEQLLRSGFDRQVDKTEARPRALQQAMKELRYTLNHPVEPPGALPFYGSHLVPLLQPTALSIIRQRSPRQHASAATAEISALDVVAQTLGSRARQGATSGRASWSSASQRPDFRKLRQIEQALDAFNATTNQAAERVAADILNCDRGQITDAAAAGPSLQGKAQDIGELLAHIGDDYNEDE